MIDRLLWRAIGLLVELDTLGHAVTDRLLATLDDRRRRRG